MGISAIPFLCFDDLFDGSRWEGELGRVGLYEFYLRLFNGDRVRWVRVCDRFGKLLPLLSLRLGGLWGRQAGQHWFLVASSPKHQQLASRSFPPGDGLDQHYRRPQVVKDMEITDDSDSPSVRLPVCLGPQVDRRDEAED